MDVISDKFIPTVPSVIDHIWSFFAGVRQRGVQSTELMLRKGTVVTGIGEVVSNDNGSLRIQPPTNGAPFYLTTMQVTSLVKKLDSSKKNYRILCIVFGSIGIALLVYTIRKYKLKRMELEEEVKRKKNLEESRRERRRHLRENDLPENQLCVVCKENPKEVKMFLLFIIGIFLKQFLFFR